MNRLGWSILIGILLVGGLFLTMVHFGGPRSGSPPSAVGGQPAPSVEYAGGYPVLGVPVAGVQRGQITDNWGDPRENGLRAHHGTDIIAVGGTLVVAAAPGTIEKLFESKLGGTTLYERSPDGAWQYYYAHLSGYVAGVHEGQQVDTGDPIAYVGDTGDAGPGNYHLHFGLSHMAPGEGWWQGTPVNAYPLLAGKPAGG